MSDLASVPGLGMGGSDPTFGPIFDATQAFGRKVKAGEEDFRASQERERAAREQQAAALRPVQQQLGARLAEGAPKPPEQDAALPTTPQAPKLNTEELGNMLSLLAMVAAAGGHLTRAPLTAALNDFAAGLEGVKTGQEAQYQKAIKSFDENFKKAKEETNRKWERYKAASEKYGTDIQGLQNELKLIAAETQSPIDTELAVRGDIPSLLKFSETQVNNLEKVGTAYANFKSSQAQHAETVRHNRAMEAKGADNSGGGISDRYSSDPEYRKQIDHWATLINRGVPLPARFAQNVGKQFSADVYKVAGNTDPGSAVANRIDLREMTSEAQKLGTQAASVAIANKELQRFIPTATKAMDAVPRGAWRPLNQVLQTAESTWSPEQGRLVLANRAVLNAFAQLIQRGAPTVHSLSEAENLLNTADSKEVYRAKLDQLTQEGVQAERGLQDARDDLLTRARGSSAPSSAPPASGAPGALPDGWSVTEH